MDRLSLSLISPDSLSLSPEGMGGLQDVAREESVEAEESSMRRAVVGGSRVVVVAGERRIRGTQWTGNGYADAELWSDSRKYSL